MIWMVNCLTQSIDVNREFGNIVLVDRLLTSVSSIP